MKSFLLKKAIDLRANNKIPKKTFPLGEHASSLFENLSKQNLLKEFEPYVQKFGSRTGHENNTKIKSRINYTGFCMVLKRFIFPGTSPVGEDASRMLFESCKESSSNNDNNNMIDPSIFFDLIFDKKKDVVTKFGFSSTIPAPSYTGR